MKKREHWESLGVVATWARATSVQGSNRFKVAEASSDHLGGRHPAGEEESGSVRGSVPSDSTSHFSSSRPPTLFFCQKPLRSGGQLLFSASSDSPDLLLAQPSAPAVTDSEQAPEVQQPGTRPPRCSSRPPFSNQPEGRKGLREDTRGAHSQRVLVVLRAEAPGAAGTSTCRSEVLT